MASGWRDLRRAACTVPSDERHGRGSRIAQVEEDVLIFG